MNEIILRRLREKIASHTAEKNSAIVLKGISLKLVGDENFPEDLDAAKKKPFRYFNALRQSERKIFTYEEFLLMQTYFFDDFDAIYILNNNLYMGQYPIESKFGDAEKDLLDYVDSQAQNLFEANARLAKIFIGLKKYENFLIGVYNDEEILNNSKVTVLNLFDPADDMLAEIDLSDAPNFIDLRTETDYVDFVRKIIFATPEEIFIRIHDKEQLKAQLKILQSILPAQIKIVRSEKITSDFKHRDEFTEILKRHWECDAFRNFKIYDRQKLYTYNKETDEISQEKIISDIVEQVENCMNGEDFRDVFVTAPTGAGKSVIFQVPAIYLAEKYNLLTIVISPLIALMNDQVKKFKLKNYDKARTINSDISPIIKEQIIEEIADGKCDILYISPETLMSRNDIEQLIGDRKIGLIAVDEAHIVTTWGKQFRPDYWYMGDHIKKMRERYSFIIATFTATAIYRGEENMYNDIIKTLHMDENDPIIYLGYVKRDDIEIIIDESQNKSAEISTVVRRANDSKEKLLIYFPWVKTLKEEEMKLDKKLVVETYHGRITNKDDKNRSYENFKNGYSFVMLATKAFGMGIDIDDIKTVMHFAPTGNVCDYVQEIGRVARRHGLKGEAIYHYSEKDFKYTKFFHSKAIKSGQLVAVAKKICEIYRRNSKNDLTLDAENFSYIFSNSANPDDEEDIINKVKIALLIIQKDLEEKYHYFQPITIRPSKLYAEGFFKITPQTCSLLQEKYGNCVEMSNPQKNIFKVNLKLIWENSFGDKAFPNFKRMIYHKDNALPAELRSLCPAYIVSIDFKDNFRSIFNDIFVKFKAAVRKLFISKKSTSITDLSKIFIGVQGLREDEAKNICEILKAAMESKKVIKKRPAGKFSFTENAKSYLTMIEERFNQIDAEKINNIFYITSDKEDFDMVLGILEAIGVLTFDITGGLNSQLCISIKRIDALEKIKKPYSSKILNEMEKRYRISLEMLKYIYEGNFNSAEIWDLLEDYFIGKIPDEVLEKATQ